MNDVPESAPKNAKSKLPRAPKTPRLAAAWQRWIAENKLQGVDDARLVETLIARGVPEELARTEVQAAGEHPYMQAAERALAHSRKMESLFGIWSTLRTLSGSLQSLDYRLNLTRDEFLNHYYAANRPVVLTNACDHWPALIKWTPEYLRTILGDQPVEIMANRDSDPDYESNAPNHKQTIPFSEYVDRVLSGPSNDYYLVANNRFFRNESTQPLLEDFTPFPEFLRDDRTQGVHLWFGPAGTVTPLHHDILNIFMAQVYGRKRVILIPSLHLPHVYNHDGVYSQVDAGKPDLETFRRYAQAHRTEVILEPGEALFLPVGWWHYVEALDISITLSFTNFHFPNRYEWKHPGRKGSVVRAQGSGLSSGGK